MSEPYDILINLKLIDILILQPLRPLILMSTINQNYNLFYWWLINV